MKKSSCSKYTTAEEQKELQTKYRGIKITDAQKMLNLAFYLLGNGEDRYMNADVLWITDFLIPRTTEDLMNKFKDYQKTGTKFYGFKIGQGETNWDKYFDKVYEIHYKQPRRY